MRITINIMCNQTTSKSSFTDLYHIFFKHKIYLGLFTVTITTSRQLFIYCFAGGPALIVLYVDENPVSPKKNHVSSGIRGAAPDCLFFGFLTIFLPSHCFIAEASVHKSRHSESRGR